MSHPKLSIIPISMVTITTLSGVVAMLPHTFANISPIDDEVTITIDSACTMGQTTLSTNPTLNPGETGTIGTSRISAYCNDANGYDIYAIGYTNGEYGNTNMTNTTGSTIPTGLSGEGSYWNMQLTPGTSTTTPSYIPTITNNFTSPSTIPNDFMKVATYPSTTIPQSEDPLSSGSYFTTAYTSHISTTQPAGVYTGQVQYVMVHPQGAPAPIVPYMQTVSQWKDKLLPNTNDTIQAIDKRDGKKYWVTKLADGNIWMTQNLDFDIIAGKTYTSADTDLPEGSTWAPVTSTHSSSDTTWNYSNMAPESYNPGNLYWRGGVDASYSGNLSSGTVTDPSATSGGTHYHIGNYYNWTAAVAMNDSSSYNAQNTDVNQSICPAGWMLPKGGGSLIGSGSFQYLVNQAHLSAGYSGNIQDSPNYFVYGGNWGGHSYHVSSGGDYLSSVVENSDSAYQFYFDANGRLYPQEYVDRSGGYSIRCIAR